MAHFIRIKGKSAGWAFVGFVVLFALISFPYRADGFGRDFATEAKAYVYGRTYYARYRCPDARGRYVRPFPPDTLRYLGSYGYRLSGLSDEDAVAFAKAAKPSCRLMKVTRRNRRFFFERVTESRYETVYWPNAGSP